ncbi:scavenger receptor cysteine-rich type 1 protein M160-like isoform X2 [Apostichopus japonicus]|uniref:scavenger receptor cysteine-rich type 1 protein M160-like isoform X2 n=1 Tax=Stichopus japonicus TaxID=307972 RepID=UPI003AB4AF5B
MDDAPSIKTVAILLLCAMLAESGITTRDAINNPCNGETFFNAEQKCVTSCGPGNYGDVSSRKCEKCAAECKTCHTYKDQCTSCPDSTYLLENRCVEDCEDKLSQGPLSKRARLVGGTSVFEGRLEVFHDGQWGTVCDDEWNIQNTRVVCKELQLGDGTVSSVPASEFNSDDLPPLIHLDNVQCQGEERNLEMCQHNGWGKHDCGHSEDVGIRCSGPEVAWLCVDSCADGYFEKDGACQLCNSSCKTCQGSADHCLLCDEPYFLQGDRCLTNCDVGFYGHTDSRECHQCSENCANCRDGITDDACTGCPEGLFLRDSRCVSSCGDLKTKHLPIRLVGGTNPYEGRVEVFIDGEWGTVCDDSWDINDVQVVCRQLGFGHALNAVGYSGFGPGSGSILMDRIDCTGEEAELLHCAQATFGDNHCFHLEDAGAICAGTSLIGASGECTEDCGTGYYLEGQECKTCDANCLECEGRSSQCTMCKPGRFLQGSSCILACEDGRFGNTNSNRCEPCDADKCELCQNGDRNDICSQCAFSRYLLGDSCVVSCPPGYFISADKCVTKCEFGHYGKNGQCLPCSSCRTCEAGSNEQVVCTSCPLGKVLDMGQCVPQCSSNKKAVPMDITGELMAPDVTTRLVGGRNHLEGRLEVFHRNEWGTVCHDHWRPSASQIACKEMGFQNFELLLVVGRESGIEVANSTQMIWLDNVLCPNSSKSIAECSHLEWGNSNCDHQKDVALKCTGPGYRKCVNECPDGYFRDGNQCVLCNANCESCGKENGQYVCHSCRQDFRLLNQQCVLQCSESYLDKGDGHCLECAAGCATCDGTVDYCTSCREGLFLKDGQCVADCGDQKKLQLTSRVRLQEGTSLSGRVEVKNNEEWGTVCDDNWSLEEAEVVCRELGLGHAVEAHPEAHFGEGTGPILLDNLQCNGDEDTIFDCGHSGIGNHDCSNAEDAGVTCSGPLNFNKCIPVEQCRDGFFVDGDNCSKCSPSCKLCMEHADNCIACEVGLYRSQGKCVRMCDKGYYGNDDNECTPCSPQCQDCEESAVQCTRCPGDSYLNVDTQTCQDSCNYFVSRVTANVRLVGGGGPLEGRVEVFHSDQWGTICDDGWDLEDATVFCKMLGLGTATQAMKRGAFGYGDGEIWLDELSCDGTERDWKDCSMEIREIGAHDCEHHEDAGVVCSGPDTARQCVQQCPEGYYDDSSQVCQQCSQQCKACTENSEQCTSCPEGLYLKDNACSETCGSGYYGHFEGECRTCHESCEECFDGAENNKCKSCKEGYFLQDSTCVSTCPEDLKSVPDLIQEFGISADQVRLIGGNNDLEGIVQVKIDGQWGGICGTNWDRMDATVVCRELGFGAAESIVKASQFNIPADYPTHLDRVQCKGFEYYLSQCNHESYDNLLAVERCDPNHFVDAAIRCSESQFSISHYTDQRICRKVNNESCGINTCYPHVPCINIGDSNSICMECPDGTFGDGISCLVAATVLPEFKIKGQNKTVTAGSPINLACVGEGSPAPEVTESSWSKNGSPLPTADLESGRMRVLTHGSLFISQARLEDRGQYTCTLKNSVGLKSQLSSVTVEELPSIVTVEPATGQIRESVTLKCLPRGFPVPTIIWKRGEETLDVYGEKYSTQNSGRLLTISNISLSDEGTYTCICRNKLGQYTADIPVTVLEPPSFLIQPMEQEVHEGDLVRLQCEAKGKPTPEVVWKKDGSTISYADSRYFLDGTALTLISVELQDMGKFSCVAINDVQVMESSANLLVIGPPHIRTAPSNKTKLSGETVDFECDVIGSSNPTVSWKKDGVEVQPDDRHIMEDGDLKITSLKPEDAGQYTCIAKNDQGSSQASASLDVNDSVIFGVEKHIGGSLKYILPFFPVLLIIGVVVCLVWRRKRNSPGKAKYDPFGVRKSSMGTSFTPIYKVKPPNANSEDGGKLDLKKEQDSMLEGILSNDAVDDHEKLVDDGQ